MNAAVLGGLVEQWVWRCQKVATQYQLRQPIDLKAEVEKLAGPATEVTSGCTNGNVTFSRVSRSINPTRI